MSKKEKKSKMLSFDKLRTGLGIDDELVDTANIKEAEDDSHQIEVKIDAPLIERKSIVENGTTFIDITDQYSFNEPEPVFNAKNTIDQPESIPLEQKKRIKTFNEIFSDFLKLFVPVKADSGNEKARKLVMDFAIIIIICCVIGIVSTILESSEHSNGKGELTGQNAMVDQFDDNMYAKAWKQAYAQSSGVGFPEGMDSKYAYLYYVNQDLVGWLRINNTDLDVQIVQSDNNDYYLNRDFYKNSSQYGCPFMDYKNNIQTLNDNTIIYGPNMKNNLMFATLNQYLTIDGYKSAPIIEFSTLYGTYNFKVFAAFISSGSPSTDYGFNFATTDFISDAKFSEFINEVKIRSIINTDISVQTDDKIITLVTSSQEFKDAKLVVMGRMIRENESADVDVSNATLNSSPKYPQAWYDKNGVNNPYSY